MVLLNSSVIGSLVFWSSKGSSTKSECIESFKRILDYNSRCLESYSILPIMSSIWSIKTSSTFVFLSNWSSILYNSEANSSIIPIFRCLQCIKWMHFKWCVTTLKVPFDWANTMDKLTHYWANWLFAPWEKLVEIYTLCTRTSNCNWIDGLNSR